MLLNHPSIALSSFGALAPALRSNPWSSVSNGPFSNAHNFSHWTRRRWVGYAFFCFKFVSLFFFFFYVVDVRTMNIEEKEGILMVVLCTSLPFWVRLDHWLICIMQILFDLLRLGWRSFESQWMFGQLDPVIGLWPYHFSECCFSGEISFCFCFCFLCIKECCAECL